jgi:hypothetical protein
LASAWYFSCLYRHLRSALLLSLLYFIGLLKSQSGKAQAFYKLINRKLQVVGGASIGPIVEQIVGNTNISRR